MKIKAKFIGRNSLGYVTGETYELILVGSFICRADKTGGYCPYQSVQSFLSNWEICCL